ncbi:MAG: tetratricopeptide repeat protein, partial [Planctomycetota bacterium]
SSANRTFRGDVETIVGKALESEKERRYQSAAELAADIRRYLDDEPIVARPASSMYQLRKFARRNKLLVGGAAGIFAALSLGVAGMAWKAHQATVARGHAEEATEALRTEAMILAVVNVIFEDLVNAVPPEEEMVTDRRTAVGAVLRAAATRAESEWTHEPLVEAAVRQLIGDTYMDSLAAYREAVPHLQRALHLREANLGKNDPATLDAIWSLANAYWNLDRLSDAEAQYRRGLETARRRMGPEAETTLQFMRGLARAYNGRPVICACPSSYHPRNDEAEVLLAEVLETIMRIKGEDDMATAEAMNDLASTYVVQARYDEAVDLYTGALKIARQQSEERVALDTMSNLGMALTGQGRLSEAERVLDEALEEQRLLLGGAHPDTTNTMAKLAGLYRTMDRLDQAETLWTEVLDLHKQNLGPEHDYTLQATAGLAQVRFSQYRYVDAEELLVELVEIRARTMGDEHPSTAEAMRSLAYALRGQERFAEAVDVYLETLRIHRSVFEEEDNLYILATKIDLAGVYVNQGRLAEAEALSVDAVEGYRARFGEEHAYTLTVMERLGEIYQRQGRYDAAEPLLEAVVDGRRRLLGPDHDWTIQTIQGLADNYRLKGDFDEAERLFVEALDALRRRGGPAWVIARVTWNLGRQYRTQGRFDELEWVHREGLRTARTAHGDDHLRVARHLHHLAEALLLQRRLNEAEVLARESLAFYKKAPAGDSEEHDHALRVLFEVLLADDQHEDAERVCREHLSLYQRELPEDNRIRLRAEETVAWRLHLLGHSGEAETMLRDILAKQRGNVHEMDSDTLLLLSMIQNGDGRDREPEQLLRERGCTGTPSTGR